MPALFAMKELFSSRQEMRQSLDHRDKLCRVTSASQLCLENYFFSQWLSLKPFVYIPVSCCEELKES